MAGRRPLREISASLILSIGLAGCAGTSEPDFVGQPTRAKQEIERIKQEAEAGAEAELPETAPPEAASASEESPAQEPEAEPEAPVDPTAAVHFETATLEGGQKSQPSLWEAAEAERLRRRETPPAQVVINDANLKDFKDAGQLTEFVTSGVEAEDGSSATTAEEEVDAETYWRTRARDARLAWRAAADRITELEEQVAQLRYDFYSEDDPYYRDSQIKPEWDRAAVELSQASLRVADLEARVRQVIAEGRRDGALPGWLREGMEFEPAPPVEAERTGQEPREAEVIEPPIVEDPPL